MRFHSSNKQSKNFSLPEVLRLGLAPDKGLFLPNAWPKLAKAFFYSLQRMSFKDIALAASQNFIKEIPKKDLKKIIAKAFNFPAPLVKLQDNIYILEDRKSTRLNSSH